HPKRIVRVSRGSGPPQQSLSRNGLWVAYVSEESGRPEVYVHDVSGAGGSYPISADGGTEPVWNPSRDDEVIYHGGSHLIAVTLSFDGYPSVARPPDTLRVELPPPPTNVGGSYDVSPDGKHFMLVKAAPGSDQPIVITGWLDDVRRRLERPR